MSLQQLQKVFNEPVQLSGNRIFIGQDATTADNQVQTEKIFSDKWTEFEQQMNAGEQSGDTERFYAFQFDWFLKLYGFDSEEELRTYLSTKKFIIDTGCGLGYKVGWFAKLAPQATVIGIDISDALD